MRADKREAFSDVIEREKGIIHKICNLYCDNRVDREDLFQEIVIQIWRSYEKFWSESKFSTWVYRVALNTALTHLKKRKPDTCPLGERQLELGKVECEGEVQERMEKLYKAIKQLPEIDRALFFLYLEDKSYEGISQTLGITFAHARVKMNRAKEKIRKLIGI